MPKCVVFTARFGNKLFMAALLNNSSLVKNQNPAAEAAGGKAMADINCGFILDDLIEFSVHFKFGHRVERGGRFIQHDVGRLLIECACQRLSLIHILIGNTVAEGGGQLAGLGLVAVPPAVAAAVIERGAVAFIKKAKGIASLPVEKFLCIALGANEDKGNGFVRCV